MAFPRHKPLHLLPYLFLFTSSALTTTADQNKTPATDNNEIPTSVLHHLISQPTAALSKQMDAPSLVEMIMFGLAGIPVYKAVGMLLPFLIGKRAQAKDNGRVLNRRHKRDLAYAQQLLNLLVTVEVALEKYGITEPQCQLRATCEIYRKNANAVAKSNNGVMKNGNAVGKNRFEGNFIKLVK